MNRNHPLRPTIDTSRIRFGQTIDPRLYSDIAEEAAREVAAAAGAKTNKASQLRRFYDELVQLHTRVGASDDRFAFQAPFIQMLKAKSAYAKARELTDENFDALLRHVVDEVCDVRTLGQAKLFMEAFMAFYKVYGPSERS